MCRLPLISSIKSVTEKIELLKILDNMKELSSMRSVISNEHVKYLSLKCNINTVTDRSEFNNITQYFNNTKLNHNCKIQKCFKINRQEEESRFSNLHNRTLLWHGSRMENFVSILSGGLKINPGNVVKTGSMFGNGLYFANCSGKSYGYIGTGKTAIMLLCEVALGNCLELYKSQYIRTLPNEYHSVHGIGSWHPSNSNVTSIDSIDISTGKIIQHNESAKCYLNYDEFVVYNVNQIKIKYLLLISR